ncbi:MAG: hypothetical protein ABSE89_02900 [Sedimentisphaerales bacterium]
MTELLIKGQVMKRLSFILSVILVVILAGCQQSQEKQTTEISRKDRLVGNENLNLKNELKSCQEEIEKQKSLVRQCEDEKEKADQQCNENIKWLMDELPKDLLDDASKLSEENAYLLSRIADLERELGQYKTQQQQQQK